MQPCLLSSPTVSAVDLAESTPSSPNGRSITYPSVILEEGNSMSDFLVCQCSDILELIVGFLAETIQDVPGGIITTEFLQATCVFT